MRIRLTAALFIASLFGLSSQATAQELYDWPSDVAPVLIVDDSGLIFIGKDKTVWRTYSWKQSKNKDGKSVTITDMDRDGKYDIVGAGKPTFILNHDANPFWFDKKGCDHVAVADIAADNKRDIACIKGSTVGVYTYDGQLVWSASIGKRYESCIAGDYNGDLKAEVECKVRGSKKYSRFDGVSGEALAALTDESTLTASAVDSPDPVPASSLKGADKMDLDGDGSANDSLLADDKAVLIQSGNKKTSTRIETGSAPLAALAKDLDGDKKREIVIITKDKIFVASADGKDVKSFKLNAKKYKRTPVAEIQSAYANGFTDDKAASEAVKALSGKLSKCYASQVRKNQFAGQGQVLVEVSVNAKGKVKSANLMHADLADKGVVKCAVKALKKGKYPAAAGEVGAINVRLFYTFRDQ